MASLIGTEPNQTPTNGDLGGMAFQDPNAVSIGGGVVCTTQDVRTGTTAPATGFSITVAPGVHALILDPAGTLATGTVMMPADPPDQFRLEVASTQTITALTVSANAGQTIKNAPTTLAAGGAFAYRYAEANSTWYKVQ